MSNFSLSLKAVDDVVVIMLRGYVNDLGAESLEQTSEQLLDKGQKKFIINFSDMQFINSIGASIITGIVQKNLEYHGRLCFTNMKKVHNEVFDMLGITQHVKVFKEEGEAISFLKEQD